MGSLAEGNQELRDGIVVMDEVATKSEPNNLEGSSSSSVSTPEPDVEVVAQDVSQQQKRKGGRKPIYATSEERKQRNRQAQAAFRERRTEYIKQLETTIKHNEDALQNLQQSHRNAADECLMLRYKNSLLERILLEKGIDVQAELRLKSGSPVPQPARVPDSATNQPSSAAHPSAGKPPPPQRQAAGVAPKPDPAPVSQVRRENTYAIQSPQLQPTPSSHVSSPAVTKSPGFALQGGVSPTGTDIHVQQQQQQFRGHPYQGAQFPPQPGPLSQGVSAMTPGSIDGVEANQQPVIPSEDAMDQTQVQGTYYISPFQKHYDQLEQGYNIQRGHIEGQEPLARTNHHQQQQSNTTSPGEDVSGLAGSESFVSHYDPMLDADPFGLTASMHFHTPFSYIQTHGRQS